MDNEFARSEVRKSTLKESLSGFGYLLFYLIVWATIIAVVWVVSAVAGFLTFGENRQAIWDYASTIALVAFIASVPFVLLSFWSTYKGFNPNRYFSGLWTGLEVGPIFLALFLLIAWIAPDQIPTPTELGITACVFIIAAAVIRTINYTE